MLYCAGKPLKVGLSLSVFHHNDHHKRNLLPFRINWLCSVLWARSFPWILKVGEAGCSAFASSSQGVKAPFQWSVRAEDTPFSHTYLPQLWPERYLGLLKPVGSAWKHCCYSTGTSRTEGSLEATLKNANMGRNTAIYLSCNCSLSPEYIATIAGGKYAPRIL